MTDREALIDRLDPQARDLVLRCGALAGARNERAFLVGGSVRDLLLGRAADDLDVVIEGDGLAVAQALARDIGGTLTRHHAFQTATVELEAGGRIDVATARREDYGRPGQLPQIVPGTLDDDLQRRDFTFNTMAIGLTGDEAHRFVDPLGGADDLTAGIVRVLHTRSFADDPTRILRALRFALRLSYRLAPETHILLAEAVNGGYLETVSGDRVRRELAYMFHEAPREAPVRLQAEGVLRELHADLFADPMRLNALQGVLRWYEALDASAPLGARWALVLALCAESLGGQDRWQLARALRLSRDERAGLIEGGAPWRKAITAWKELSAADRRRDRCIERVFRGVGVEGLLVAAAAAEHVDVELCEAVRRHLGVLRHVRPVLGGEELRELGVSEGPEMGKALEALRAARLDGEAASEADERRLVAAWIAEKRLE